MTDNTTPKKTGWLVWLAYYLLKGFFKVYFRLRCTGCQSLDIHQIDRPLILVFNHSSNLDPLIIPTCLGRRNALEVMAVAKKELFKNPVTGFIVKGFGGFPLDREQADTAAVRTILKLLKSGKSVLLAPEGTRSPTGEIQPFNPAFVRLAEKANAYILPIGITGAHQAFPRGAGLPRPHQVTVHFGDLIDLADYRGQDWRGQGKPQVVAEMIRQDVMDLAR